MLYTSLKDLVVYIYMIYMTDMSMYMYNTR